jgi:hypothetical protein
MAWANLLGQGRAENWQDQPQAASGVAASESLAVMFSTDRPTLPRLNAEPQISTKPAETRKDSLSFGQMSL